MYKLESIQQKIERNWEEDKFAGQLRNKKGESDIGVNFQAYEDEVEKRAKESSCTRVLQPGSLGLLSDIEIQQLNDRLNFLNSQLLTNETLRSISLVRKELRENNTLKTDINSQAAKVLLIRKDISTSNVNQSIDSIAGPHFGDDIRALRLVQTTHGEMFFGEPSDRKNTFIKHIENIGIARTIPHLLMLLGQLDHVFVKTRESLCWKDLDGVMQPYDICVRPFGELEKLGYLQARMSSSETALTIARQTVQIAIRDRQTFDSVNQTLTADLSADRPSLDNDPSIRKTSAFAAITASTSSLSDEEKAYYFDAGKRSRDGDSYKQIVSPVQTIAPLPPYVPHLTPYASAPQKCHHWNGEVCDFQVKTGNTCKYASSHKPLVSSFTHSFAPRPPTSIIISSEENELFKRFKREQASNNSSSH
jgi:hypothetical protein